MVYDVTGLAVNTMPTADIPSGLGMMGRGMMGMGMTRDMPRMMGFVGEESIGMMIDMPAARAWMMGRRRAGALRWGVSGATIHGGATGRRKRRGVQVNRFRSIQTRRRRQPATVPTADYKCIRRGASVTLAYFRY